MGGIDISSGDFTVPATGNSSGACRIEIDACAAVPWRVGIEDDGVMALGAGWVIGGRRDALDDQVILFPGSGGQQRMTFQNRLPRVAANALLPALGRTVKARSSMADIDSARRGQRSALRCCDRLPTGCCRCARRLAGRQVQGLDIDDLAVFAVTQGRAWRVGDAREADGSARGTTASGPAPRSSGDCDGTRTDSARDRGHCRARSSAFPSRRRQRLEADIDAGGRRAQRGQARKPQTTVGKCPRWV